MWSDNSISNKWEVSKQKEREEEKKKNKKQRVSPKIKYTLWKWGILVDLILFGKEKTKKQKDF